MNHERAMAILTDIEAEQPVATWTVAGLPIWPLFRIQLEMKLRRVLLPPGTPPLPEPDTRFLEQRWDALFLTNTSAIVSVGDQSMDRFCALPRQHLRDHGLRCLTFELPNKGDRAPIVAEDHVPLTPALCKPVGAPLPDPEPEFDRAADARAFSEALNRFTREGLAPIPVLGLRQQVAAIREAADFFRVVIGETGIRIAFCVCFYSPAGMGLMLACKEAGIPSIDLQHGVMGSTNPIFAAWQQVPEGGYPVLPEHFWCWSEQDAAIIEHWSRHTPAHAVLRGGWLWLDAWRSDRITPADFGLTIDLARDPDELRLLVTLQPVHPLPQWLLDVIRSPPAGWRWWLRFHPRMSEAEKATVRQQVAGKAELDWVSDLPIHAVLRHADIHITAWSATIIEAEIFGVPSIALEAQAEIYFREHFDHGWAVRVEDAVGLRDAVAHFRQTDRKPFNRYFADAAGPILDDLLTRCCEPEPAPVAVRARFAEHWQRTIEDASDPLVRFYRGRQLRADGQPERARVLLERIVTEDPVLAFHIRRERLEAGDRTVVEDLVHEAMNDPSLRTTVLHALFTQGHETDIRRFDDKDDPASLYFTGRAAKNRGDYPHAVARLERFLSHELSGTLTRFRVSALFHLGEALDRLNDPRAAKIFRRCLVMSGGNHKKASSYLEKWSKEIIDLTDFVDC